MPGAASRSATRAERAAGARELLPARYAEVWEGDFLAAIADVARAGSRILDVGSGARPAVAPARRPPGCRYVGLDVSDDELKRSDPGAYDECVVGDICAHQPALAGQFDVVISWQVLEHVSSMRAALATQRAALAPGGRMVALLSGSWGIHSLAARAIPYPISTALQARLLGVDERDKFPTRYDGCSRRALNRLFAAGGWSSWRIEPRYRAGEYLLFAPSLLRAYLCYENWIARRGKAGLATHYLVVATA